MKQTKVAFYLRVSTDKQTIENQLQELQAVADRENWQVVAIYKDEGISGAKGRDKRPGFDALTKAAVKRQFDLVAAWSVDRIGRNLNDLTGFLAELHARQIDLYLHKQSLDTRTPAGKAMFQMMGIFAEFEREMIRERVIAGLERVRVSGSKSGKPIGRQPIQAEKVETVIHLHEAGYSYRRIAKETGISIGKISNILAS